MVQPCYRRLQCSFQTDATCLYWQLCPLYVHLQEYKYKWEWKRKSERCKVMSLQLPSCKPSTDVSSSPAHPSDPMHHCTGSPLQGTERHKFSDWGAASRNLQRIPGEGSQIPPLFRPRLRPTKKSRKGVRKVNLSKVGIIDQMML